MTEFQVSKETGKVQKLIRALESILKVEKNRNDRRIHLEALKRLRSYLKENKKHPLARVLSEKTFN